MYVTKAQSKHLVKWNNLLFELAVLAAECVSLSVRVVAATRCPAKSLNISGWTYTEQVWALMASEDEPFAMGFSPLRKSEIWVRLFYLQVWLFTFNLSIFIPFINHGQASFHLIWKLTSKIAEGSTRLLVMDFKRKQDDQLAWRCPVCGRSLCPESKIKRGSRNWDYLT